MERDCSDQEQGEPCPGDGLGDFGFGSEKMTPEGRCRGQGDTSHKCCSVLAFHGCPADADGDWPRLWADRGVGLRHKRIADAFDRLCGNAAEDTVNLWAGTLGCQISPIGLRPVHGSGGDAMLNGCRLGCKCRRFGVQRGRTGVGDSAGASVCRFFGGDSAGASVSRLRTRREPGSPGCGNGVAGEACHPRAVGVQRAVGTGTFAMGDGRCRWLSAEY